MNCERCKIKKIPPKYEIVKNRDFFSKCVCTPLQLHIRINFVIMTRSRVYRRSTCNIRFSLTSRFAAHYTLAIMRLYNSHPCGQLYLTRFVGTSVHGTILIGRYVEPTTIDGKSCETQYNI